MILVVGLDVESQAGERGASRLTQGRGAAGDHGVASDVLQFAYEAPVNDVERIQCLECGLRFLFHVRSADRTL